MEQQLFFNPSKHFFFFCNQTFFLNLILKERVNKKTEKKQKKKTFLRLFNFLILVF